MTDIALTLATRGNLLAIQAGEEMLARTSVRLATGNKVNTALDNPTAFFTSRGLNARATQIERLTDGMGLAQDTIKSAERGLRAIKDMLGQARAALEESIKAGAGDGLNVDADIQSTVNGTDIRNRNVRGAGGPSQRLTLSVGKEASTTFTYGTDGTTVEDVYNHFKAEFDAGRSPIEPYWVDNTPGSVADGGNGVTDYNSIGFRARGEVVLFATTDETQANNIVRRMGLWRGPNYTRDAGTGHALTGWKEGLERTDSLSSPEYAPFFTDNRWYSDLVDHGNGGISYVKIRRDGAFSVNQVGSDVEVRASTLGEVIDGINQANDLGRFDFRAQLTDKGQFQLVSTSDEARLRLPNGGIQHHGLGLGWGAGDLVPAATRTADGIPAFSRYDAVVDRIDELARDSEFNGRNLLDNDILSVGLNEKGGKLTLTGEKIDLDSLGLGDIVEADFVSLRTMEIVSGRLDEAEKKIDAAMSRLANSIAVLDIRETFTDQLSTVLRGGAAKLTLADANEEGANMLATQTRLQLSSQALQLTTQSDRSVLQLF